MNPGLQANSSVFLGFPEGSGQRDGSVNEAQIAVQAEHEIRCVPGREFAPFPTEFQRTVVFAAAVSANAEEAEAAKTFIKFLTAPEAIAVIKAKCMEPG